MNRWVETILSYELAKFAITVLIITVSVIIIWLMFRELRLWYWKIETIIKILGSINRRLKSVEKKLSSIKKGTTLVNESTVNMRALILEAMVDMKKTPGYLKEDETEQEIEQRIKE